MKMLQLTRTNGCTVGIMAEHIQAVDDQGTKEEPSVWVQTTAGKNICVKESAEEIIRMINGE